MKKNRCIVSVCHALMLMVLLLGLPSLSYAYDFVENGFGYNRLIFPDNAVEVGCYRNLEGEVQIPSSMSHRGKTYKVIQIAYEGFKDCRGMTSVTIPRGVNYISPGAFENCSGLTSITLSEGVTSIGISSFKNCSGLTSITLPEGVTSIGESAFSGCRNLTSIAFPKGVTSIGASAFSSCINLTSIAIPKVTSIGESAFSGCRNLTSITIPNVTSIGASAFSGCGGLTSITLPVRVPNTTTIGDYAFSDCSGLTSITIPKGVTSIGRSAFSGCSGLTSIVIPESVTKMGSDPFKGCDRFVSISIPSDFVKYIQNFANLKSLTVFGDVNFKAGDVKYSNRSLDSITVADATYIGSEAFKNCHDLTYLSIPNSVTSIGRDVFYGLWNLSSLTIPCRYIDDNILKCSRLRSLTVYGEEISHACSQLLAKNPSLTTLTIKEATSIGESAFSGCSGLTSITLPEGVKTIGNSAFAGCSGLTSITLPRTVTSIGNSAFAGCSGLTSITIPGVYKIGEYAFSGCSGLTSISHLIADNIGNYAFAGCSGLTSISPIVAENIGISAFAGCSGLTSIELAARKIGNSAFSNCSGLTSATISARMKIFGSGYHAISIGNSVFSGCSSLTSVTLPDNVTCISDSVFSGCSSLASITLPDSVTSICSYAFDGCTNLQSVNISTKLTTLGRAAFRNCSSINQALSIPNTITSVADETFAGCSNIPSIRLTSMVTSIGNNAFEGCKAIKAFSFPSKISTIGKSAFRYCSNLASVVLPSTVTKLGDFAFADCENLESATINSSIEVNYSIFENDNKLKKWDFKGNYTDGVAIYDTKRTKLIKVMNTSIEEYSTYPYDIWVIGPHAFANCKNLIRIRIGSPEYLSTIGDSAFLNCEKLKIDFSKFPSTHIGNGCFANCRSLTDVIVSGGRSIGSSAFAGCSGLKTAKFSSSCWYIPDALFKDCSELQRVEINNRKLEEIGSEAFMNCKNLTYPWDFLYENLRIGKDAFIGCTSLNRIRVRNVLPLYSMETFAANTIVYVPLGCKEQYQTILPECTIYEVGDKESIECKELLSLYNSYNELDYQPLVHNDLSTGDNVLTEASQLSANFIDDYEGSLDALVDNSDDTYFLSPWDKDNPTKAYHYIQVDLKKAYKGLNISFKRRNTSDPSAPTKVRVFVTNTPNDENSWIDCGIASLNYNGLEATINSHYYDKMRYVRLQVEATTDNAKDNGNLFFALNKLVIKPGSFNVPIEKWDDGLYYAIKDKSIRETFNKGTLMGTVPLELGYFDFEKFFLSLSFSSPIEYCIIKYLKSSDNPAKKMWVDTYAERDCFDADYRYFDESTGIYCKQSEHPFSSLLLGANSGKLQSAHIYTRPPKADLMPWYRRDAIKSMLSKYDNENSLSKKDYEILQNYCNDITRCAQTGRYVDFLDYDYLTFYADYPAVVPMLVKAGIVKEENGELVVDYIYNEGDVIPANTGVILKGNCRGNAYVMKEGTTDATSPEGNLLHGTIDDEETCVDGCSRYYMLSYDKATDCRLGFYWNGENGPQPFINRAYKAYLAIPDTYNAMGKDSFSLAEMEENHGEITHISSVSNDKGHVEGDIYGIDGRKIDATNIKQLPAGVYIVNGKKVIVK